MTKPKRTSERRRDQRGRGSVYFRERDQLWVGELSRTADDGRRERRYVTGRDPDAVNEKLDELRRSWKRSPTTRRDGSMTVGRHLDSWLSRMKPTVAANTYRGREQHVRVHLKPALGTKRLDRLSVRDVERLLNEIVNVKGLSARTANHVRVTLRIALAEAQRDGLVAQNVAALAKAPPVKTTEILRLLRQRLGAGVAGAEIWEATNGGYPLEKAKVEVSQDGSSWSVVGTADNTSGTGPNRGSSFDVGQWFKFVKLTDVSNKTPFEPTADAFDVDGIKALQRCKDETAWGANYEVGALPFPGGSWATYIDTGITNG
jgi:hypothetical protein